MNSDDFYRKWLRTGGIQRHYPSTARRYLRNLEKLLKSAGPSSEEWSEWIGRTEALLSTANDEAMKDENMRFLEIALTLVHEEDDLKMHGLWVDLSSYLYGPRKFETH